MQRSIHHGYFAQSVASNTRVCTYPFQIRVAAYPHVYVACILLGGETRTGKEQDLFSILSPLQSMYFTSKIIGEKKINTRITCRSNCAQTALKCKGGWRNEERGKIAQYKLHSGNGIWPPTMRKASRGGSEWEWPC